MPGRARDDNNRRLRDAPQSRSRLAKGSTTADKWEALTRQEDIQKKDRDSSADRFFSQCLTATTVIILRIY
jgi:hypothetical protein